MSTWGTSLWAGRKPACHAIALQGQGKVDECEAVVRYFP